MNAIEFDEIGPRDGRPIVFVHGYLTGGELWRPLAERLAAAGHRCLMPTWPLGAQRRPAGGDTSPLGVAARIAGFLDDHDLEDVVLVGNDSGGALCQLVVTEHDSPRIGGLVLTDCDAFANFPPSFFKALVPVAKLPGGLRAALAPMRFAAVRRSPLGFGLLSFTDIDDLAAAWVRPSRTDPAVFAELKAFTVGVDPALTLDAAARLPRFGKPALVVWATDDAFFPLADGRRLAMLLDAPLKTVAGRCFSMIDRPDEVAAAITGWLGGEQEEAAGPRARAA